MRLTELEMPDQLDGKPTRNSLGKLIHPQPEGVRNFWKWFGDSQAVDAQGRPLVVYHATTGNFGEFDFQKTKKSSRFGPGFYFSGDQQTLAVYSGKDGGNVLPAYLRITSPVREDYSMTAQQVEQFFGALQDRVFANGYDATQDHATIKQEALENLEHAFGIILSRQVVLISNADWRRGLAAIGVDGIIGSVYGHPEYVVLSSQQIKSAVGNSGKFSINSPNVSENSIPESFDTQSNWVLGHESANLKVFAALINDQEDYVELSYETSSPGQVDISFTRDHSTGITNQGRAHSVFGAVINHIKQYLAETKPTRVVFVAHKPLGAFGSKDTTRSSLYRRIVQRLAAQLGYQYQVVDLGNQDQFVLTARINETDDHTNTVTV